MALRGGGLWIWISGGVLDGESRGCAPQRTRHGQGVGRRAAGIGSCFVLQRMGGGENQGFSGVFSACFVLLEMSPGSCEVLERMDCHTLPPTPLPPPSPRKNIFRWSRPGWIGECAGVRTRTHTRTHTLPPGSDIQTPAGRCHRSPPHPAHRQHTQPRSRIHTHTTQVPNQAGRSSKAGSLKFKLLLLWYINMER